MTPDQYLLHKAYNYYLKGEPFPVDIYIELEESGFDPDAIAEQFAEGYRPGDILRGYNN